MRHRDPDNLGRFVLALLVVLLLAVSCESRGQVFADGFECIECGPVLPECATTTDPLAHPQLAKYEMTWGEAFYGQTFPHIANGGMSPVGSFTFRTSFRPSGYPMLGRYIAVRFVADALPHKVKWYRSQAIGSRDYRVNKPADAALVSVSECPGDFRLNACSDYNQDGRIFFGPESLCRTEAGKTYYLNIAFANPYLGLVGHTCEDPAGVCNANFGD